MNLDTHRRDWRNAKARGTLPQHCLNYVVAYLVPGPVWRAWARFPYWHRWYWHNR